MKSQTTVKTDRIWKLADETKNRQTRTGKAEICMVSSTASATSENRSFVFSLMRSMSQVGFYIVLAVVVLGITHRVTSRPSPIAASDSNSDTRTLSPAAYSVEEIYLPRSLLGLVNNATLRDILRLRDSSRLDAFLETRGLQDTWFLVRYRPVNADGSTWLGRTDDFDCKRYQVHSSRSDRPENRLMNLEVFARSMARGAGRQADTLVTDAKTDTTPLFVAHFSEATIIPIPDNAMGFENLSRDDIASWRREAGLVAR